jgi:hypothetical protein
MDAEFEIKNQTLATLFIIFACLQAVVFLAAFIAFTMALAGTFAAQRADDPVLQWYTAMAVWGIVMMPVAVLLFVFALVAGIGIKKRKPYGRIWGMIAAVVALLEFPIGTVLGVYALRLLANDRSKQIYSSVFPVADDLNP